VPTLSYDLQRIRQLADRAGRVADHLAAGRCDDPLAADAVVTARTVAAHVNDGWLPALAAIAGSRALLDPIGLDAGSACPLAPDGHVIADAVAGFSAEERTYFQGYVDADATSVAQELWLYDAEPNYDTSRLPDELATLDSPNEWGWLAQLYLVEQYHQMVRSGDVEMRRDGDAYWVDPLDLQDTASLVTADAVLAAVASSGSLHPGSGFSEASAATHVAPMPEPRPIGLTTEESWGRMDTLQDHVVRHGADFNARDANDYARQASEFLQQPGTLIKVDESGVIRVYDPATNTFGAYNPSGTAKTFFKPNHASATNFDYWTKQPGRPM
jgi:hypothetical protein